MWWKPTSSGPRCPLQCQPQTGNPCSGPTVFYLRIFSPLTDRFHFVCLFETKVSLCSPGWLGLHYVAQIGLKLMVILQPWDYRHELASTHHILRKRLLLRTVWGPWVAGMQSGVPGWLGCSVCTEAINAPLLTHPPYYSDARLKLMVLSPCYRLLILHYPQFISSPLSFFPLPGSPTVPHIVHILLPR